MNKTYNPKEFEDRIYNEWLAKGCFEASANKDKKPFTLMMPPPNITGQLHIGHALDLSIQDAIIRYKRMKGFEALYMPGTDHASIATEVKIVEALRAEGQSKQGIGREGFLKRAFEWNDKYGGRIVEQQRKMGLSCDWRRSAFTMDEDRSRAVREVFVRMYNEGIIYRGERIINRCPTCGTALSDAEVEFEASDSHLWHVKYPYADGEGFLTVATTRPETILGDTAVAVNPRDKRYKHLVGKNLILPLTDRVIPVIADDYVEIGFGSGAVKITPAHDPNDFEVGLRHNLAVISVIDAKGVMNGDEAGQYRGLNRFEARKAIAADLDKQGFLLKAEPYTHNVGHCYRCRDTIEPAVSKQWFVRMDKLAAPAIEAVKKGKIKFIPKRFEKLYLHWMQNTRDWCVSRQLWWGHRIPVYYCDKCGMEIAAQNQPSACKCGGVFVQDEDVLDTWFSSALWPFATLNWPQKSADLDYFYPTDVLVTAYDIIGFWVSRMIFSGLKHMDEVPFTEVVIHGLVRDTEGKKMSKSSGNGVDPLEAIDTMGADALRISLMSGISMGGDTKYSKDKLETYRNFMNKIWNAARFVLMNSENTAVTDVSRLGKRLMLADKWILGRLRVVTARMNKLMDKYEVGLAASTLYDFVWAEFCDWYIEAAKIPLNSGDVKQKETAVSVLLHVLREILKLAHPLIPFITAEIYNSLPNKDFDDIVTAPYPAAKGATHGEAIKDMSQAFELIKSIRNLRREMNVSQSKRTGLVLVPVAGSEALLGSALCYIEKLAFCNSCEIAPVKPEGKHAALITPIAEAYIPMGDLVDTEKELLRLGAELKAMENEIERANAKLSNPGFVSKAPPSLIESEKEKLNKYLNQKELLLVTIAKLKE